MLLARKLGCGFSEPQPPSRVAVLASSDLASLFWLVFFFSRAPFSAVCPKPRSQCRPCGHMRLLTLRVPRFGLWQGLQSSVHPLGPHAVRAQGHRHGIPLAAAAQQRCCRLAERGKPLHTTPMRLAFCTGASMFMSARRTFWATQAPASHQRPLKRDRLAGQAARWSPKGSSWPLREAGAAYAAGPRGTAD